MLRPECGVIQAEAVDTESIQSCCDGKRLHEGTYGAMSASCAQEDKSFSFLFLYKKGEYANRLVKLLEALRDRYGYRHIIIAPEPDEKITWLKRSFETIHGKVSVEYDEEHLSVQIPANTTATIFWKGKEKEVGSGYYIF